MDRVLLNQVWFLLSGVFQTLLVQQLSYVHAADAWTQFPVLLQFVGMAMCWFFAKATPLSPKDAQHETIVPILGGIRLSAVRTIGCLTLIDVIGATFSLLGVISAGSGLYQVVYSSLLVFAAILRRTILGRVLRRAQWFGLLITTAGLAVSALQGNEDNSDTADGSSDVAAGFVFTLLSTLCYSLNYILFEKALTTGKVTPPTPQQVCVMTGVFGTLLNAVYIAVFVLRDLDQFVPTASATYVAVLYGAYTLCAWLHNITFFELLTTSGAVSTGILQALRAISVFLLSSALYCSSDPNQCMNSAKFFSLVLVVIGVIKYSVETSRAERSKETSSYETVRTTDDHDDDHQDDHQDQDDQVNLTSSFSES